MLLQRLKKEQEITVKKKKTFFSLHCIWNFPVEENKAMKRTAIAQIQLIYRFIW